MFALIRAAVLVGAAVFLGAYLVSDRLPPSDQPKPTAATVARAATAAAPALHGSEMAIPMASNGHFMVDADVNSQSVQFVVDTGATSIVLSPDAAAAAGIRPGRDQFTVKAQTANGIVPLAPVRLREIRLGSFVAYDIQAMVNGTPMDVSLLGMSFLQRLQSYEVAGGKLHLRW